jgi:hypothetical protein
MLQMVEQSFLIAPPATRQASQSAAAEIHATNSHVNGVGDADGIWDGAEGDGLENCFVHETGGGLDDLEMDDTEE